MSNQGYGTSGGWVPPRPPQSPYAAPPQPPYGPTYSLPVQPYYPAPPPPRPRRSMRVVVIVCVVLFVVTATIASVVVRAILSAGTPHAHVSTPAAIGTLRLSTDPEDVKAAEEIRTQVRAVGGASIHDLAAGVYNDPSQPGRYAIVVAATGVVRDPAAALNQILPVPQAGLPIVHAVDLGRAGGVARCASNAAGYRLTICAWADADSLGSVTLPLRDDVSAVTLFRQIYAAVVTRD